MVHFDQSIHFGESDRNVPFHDKIVFPSTARLYPDYKKNNQMRSGLGRVCATRMYRSIVQVEFPKFQTGIFVEWKVLIVYNVKFSVPAAFLRDMDLVRSLVSVLLNLCIFNVLDTTSNRYF